MRNRVDVFLAKIMAFLEREFSRRVAEINATERILDDIALWDTGFDGVANGLTHYPGCLLLVDRRRLVDSYFSSFSLMIGIALTGDDLELLQKQGHLWEDILEDTIRSDWHLGGSCIDATEGKDMFSDCVSGVYMISITLECTVDLGGFVYEDKKNAVPEMRVLGEEGSSQQGSEVLPTLRNNLGAGEEEGRQESAIKLEEDTNGSNGR